MYGINTSPGLKPVKKPILLYHTFTNKSSRSVLPKGSQNITWGKYEPKGVVFQGKKAGRKNIEFVSLFYPVDRS
jgi:hypothetical protein